ncbi:hypothetical protein HDU67_007028 [Dinochytrium kinnereticum]|nr:hypothetical protein HDU67_007028 [Dinochytrium kinnereticum]
MAASFWRDERTIEHLNEIMHLIIPALVLLAVVFGIYFCIHSYNTSHVILFGMPKAGTTALLRKLLHQAPFDPNAKKIYEPEYSSIAGKLCYILDANQYLGSPYYDIIVPEFKKSAEMYVFVVDLSNPSQFPKAKEEFQKLLQDPDLAGKPCAVFGTKSDAKEAVDVRRLAEALGLDMGGKERARTYGSAIELFPVSVREDRGYQQGEREA